MDTRSHDLQQEYKKRFEGIDQYREDVWKILCNQFFAKYIKNTDTVLDLGAGWGEFSRNITAHAKFSMDLNPDCGDRVSGYSAFIQQDCSDPWPFQNNFLDVVFTSNFLEHLPDKNLVDKTLSEAERCLKPGGKIICLGPNIKFVGGSYWDFWDHYIPISEQSMAEALLLKQFKIVKKIDKFLPYTMSTGNNPPLVALKIYLNMPIAWRFLGKQFLVIAEKPN